VACCHYYEFSAAGEQVFAVDVSAIKFGPGALCEAGADAAELGLKRVALFTDRNVARLEHMATLLAALREAKVDTAIYDEVRAAAEFARSGDFDGFISLGGGSVIDTCKAANLYSTYPADFLGYVNAPIGDGRPVPGPLKPHIACPTTCGTGSECTGIAVFDFVDRKVKTGIASRALRPTRAIDPTCSYTLPAAVVAASGFDVLSHALESYTAVPFSRRPRPQSPALRPMSQGANPYSDIGCEKAMQLSGRYLVRATRDASDREARDNMMFAATLAGIAFGNSGVHVPHGMSYSVAGLVRDYRPEGYPADRPICPHGISVIVNAPAAFNYTSSACPDRHLRGAELLGADTGDITSADAGAALALHITRLMQATSMPNGITGVGYGPDDIPDLVEGALAQQRLLNQSPRDITRDALTGIYRDALNYW
jgi:alcohol dehydrogenase class IV